jgi:dipeptidyl aminopeptidase/acylaminoacyl peptidase
VRGMVPDDVYELTGVSDPRLSPDGGTVAYVVSSVDRKDNGYRSSIWLVPTDGSEPPRRLTWGPKRDSDPRWSPDGSRIVFVSERPSGADGKDTKDPRDEDKAGQLYVLDLAAGGEARRLTELKEDVAEPVWSPDGRTIAFSSRVRDAAYEESDPKKRGPRRFTRLQYKFDSEGWTGDRRQHLFTVPADGSGAAVQLTSGNFEDGHPTWSPDGRRIAFVSGRHEDWDIWPARDVYVVDAAGGEPELLTKTDGFCDEPAWSPDGSRIALHYTPGVFDDPRHTQIAVIDAGGGAPSVLTTSLDRQCGPYPSLREPLWQNDRLVFGVEDSGNTHLYRVAADGSEKPELLLGGDQVLTGVDLVGDSVAHAVSTATTLSELFAGERQLTSVGEHFLHDREIVAPERFTATSEDGAEVEAWIIRPAGFDPTQQYPVLVNIHGGPFTQYGNKLFDEFQVYAGAGYVVVYGNPRGSSGYTEGWARAIRGPLDGPGWGSVDYDDVMAVTEEAIRRFPFCDGDHVGVMGGSYGGFLTSWVVSHTDRFATGISERSVNNWVSQWGSSDVGWDKGYIGKFVFEDVDAWLKISPSTYATEIHTPLLILHSENDLRCPIEQGEHLFTTLRLLKREVEMVRFPDESHELSRSGSPAHRVMRFEVILEWLARSLKPEA